MRILLTVGIFVGCFFPWINWGLFKLSALNWTPGIFLIIVCCCSIISEFYSWSSKEFKKEYVFLANGIIGMTVCAIGFLLLKERADMVEGWLEINSTEILTEIIGLGYYITAFSSSFLTIYSLIGVDFSKRSINENNLNVHSELKPTPIIDKNEVLLWLEQNPGKTLNDYYSFKKRK